jgi:hypothetical protein
MIDTMAIAFMFSPVARLRDSAFYSYVLHKNFTTGTLHVNNDYNLILLGLKIHEATSNIFQFSSSKTRNTARLVHYLRFYERRCVLHFLQFRPVLVFMNRKEVGRGMSTILAFGELESISCDYSFMQCSENVTVEFAPKLIWKPRC